MSKEHVAELERIRKDVGSGAETFICNALRRMDKVLNRIVANEIADQIALDMKGRYTLNRWLADEYGIFIYELLNEGHRTKIRNTRLAWIDALIEYWRDKP